MIRVLCPCLVLLGLGLSGCGAGRSDAAEGAHGRKLKVTCTVGMVADVAAQIGGEHVAVTSLMGPGVNPHLYKATAGDNARLIRADLVLYSGLHLEGKLTEVLEALAKRKPTVAVTDRIPRELLLKPPEFEGLFDPHVWFDVSLWMSAAEVIRDTLMQVDPDHADHYRRRGDAYMAELAELHEWCKARAAEIPADRRILVTSHDAYNYFGRAYGFKVVAVQGLSAEEQATTKAVVDLSSYIRNREIKAIFTESSVSPKAIRAVIQDCQSAGWQVVEGGEIFSDALDEPGKPGGTYIGMVRHNIHTIVDALK